MSASISSSAPFGASPVTEVTLLPLPAAALPPLALGGGPPADLTDVAGELGRRFRSRPAVSASFCPLALFLEY